MQKVAFLLPHGALRPIGGFKMVFEYANRLVKRGWDVTLVYPSTMQHSLTLRDVARYIGRLFTKGYQPSWFHLDQRIHQQWVLNLEHYRYEKDCIVVGTFITTVMVLNKYNLPASQKAYFIQGFDVGEFDDKDILRVYQFQMKKIVISHWLEDILDSIKEPSYYVPNGFDTDFFKKNIQIEERDGTNLIYMYHIDPGKAVDVAFRAFDIVKQQIPNLHITLFSAYNKPDGLPNWYDFYHSPDHDTFVRIYNEAAIYVGSSNQEGWGLTIGEAMMCGCAVVCTDNKGYLEMAQDGVNALVSPVGNAEALAMNIIKLIEDNQLRYRLANAGYEFIQTLDIEKSTEKFEKALMAEI
jgi:glycosyltransferase involved in cell wall biosynthesis